jgi:WD40 repeat protein
MTTLDHITQGKINESLVTSIPNNIGSICFSPDKTFICVGCEKGLLHFVNASSGEITRSKAIEFRDVYGQTVAHTISAIVVTKDRPFIIVASRVGVAMLNYNCEILFSLPLEGWNSPRVKISPDETLLAVSDDTRVIIYRVQDFRKMKEFETGGGSVGIEFSRDGKNLYTGGNEGKFIQKWDVEFGYKISEVSAHNGIILDLATSGDGQSLISSGEDFHVKKWSSASLESLPVTGMANGKENQLTLSPDYSVLATACISRLATLRNPESLEVLWESRFENYCTSICFSEDGTSLAAADDRGKLKVWTIG